VHPRLRRASCSHCKGRPRRQGCARGAVGCVSRRRGRRLRSPRVRSPTAGSPGASAACLFLTAGNRMEAAYGGGRAVGNRACGRRCCWRNGGKRFCNLCLRLPDGEGCPSNLCPAGISIGMPGRHQRCGSSGSAIWPGRDRGAPTYRQ
jgi:hypothetical protein